MTLSRTARLVVETTAKSEGVPPELIKEAFALWEGKTTTPVQLIQREFLTVPESCDLLRCSRTTLFREEQDGRIQSVRLRGRKLFERAELINALRRGKGQV